VPNLRVLDLRERDTTDPRTYEIPRGEVDIERALESVAGIVDEVISGGNAAVLDLGERFDGVRPSSLRVPAEAIGAALEGLSPDVRSALQTSIERLRATCIAELEESVTTEVAPGASVRRRIVPMQRVGLYVPGGLAPLVSTVVMNVVPAQVAGVPSLALVSPPQKEFGGNPHPTILAACALLGVDEVYAAGGAQAVAMLAYGTETVVPVNLITGPGNIYVAAAKRYVRGTVAIDSEAGPTEIAIIADSTADASFVAADLISQAEHDPIAASVLITDSTSLADAVAVELESQVAATKHAERVTTALNGPQSAVVLVRDTDQAVQVANAYAAEHLEIHTRDAAAVAERIVNAGAIFVGPWSPVSLGDYTAGSNHVLPTAGCACHSSGLSVRAFVKNVQVITYGEAALRDVSGDVQVLADAEDLPAHGAAVRVRFERPE
jgi:histidinol dehydrogenase